VKKQDMLWKVLLAIVLAFIAGWWAGPTSGIGDITWLFTFDLFGTLFLNALTLLVIPLVSSSIVAGIGSLGQDKDFSRLGAKTFFFYFLTMVLAAIVGVTAVNVIRPGDILARSGADLMGHLTVSVAGVSADSISAPPLTSFLYKLIPNNIFAAASSGNMLGVIGFSLLLGFTLARMDHPSAQVVQKFFHGIFMITMRMTHLLMRMMPLGVFFLVARVVAQEGLASIVSLAWFFLTVLGGLLIYVLLVLPAVFKLRGLSPMQHIRAIGPALLAAFSTSSSAASLPVTMECVEKRAGVSNRICSFVVPLGTSVNMSGSALYECVAVLFIAQAMGLHLSLGQQIIVVMMSLMTAMGMAGIPSASLVSIIVILNSLGLPAAAISLIIPVDRLLDMCRTTANVFSDASCAVLVAHSEGEHVLTPIKTQS